MQMWPYVVGRDLKGKPVILGPYNSKGEAQQVADRQEGEVEVREFPTESNSAATSMWKKERADEGESIAVAMGRVSHPKEAK